ncbi:EF-Tu/IF-2/RF-3 family GTPase [Streptomyces sp. NPDC001339]|uniref:EF-Tu/IF-2/RF-3 family GTPase n=1 Tax=Streptomyces sp. NPDC001339 TaxID=3364563 RepID=UPI0036BFE31A
MEQPFLMVVEDVFPGNKGWVVREVLATGRIERGRVSTGDEVELVGFGGGALARVAGIELFRQGIDEAEAGMNVALRLPGALAEELERGQVLATPGSIGARAAFIADMAVLPEKEGGAEVLAGQELDFYLRAAAVRGVVTLPHGLDALRPVHMATVTVRLERPVALEDGQHFPFRHRGRAAGSGTVTRLLD